MRIEEWLPQFLTSHVARHPGIAWPAMGSDQFLELAKVWRYQFVTHGITPDVADDASYGLAGIEHKEGNHLAIFMRLCREIVQARGSVSGSGPEADPLKAATLASADCPDCAGGGWAVRYVHECIAGKLNDARGDPVPIGASVGIPCSCELGRHIARAGGFRLTVDQYPSLRLRAVPWSDRPDNRFRHPPGRWDDAASRPVEDVVIRNVAELRAYVASLAGSFSIRRAIGPEESRPASAARDPVIDRDRAGPELADFRIPEDDWTQFP